MSSGMLRRVALVRTDVLKEFSASIIRVTRIGELGTTLAVVLKIYLFTCYIKETAFFSCAGRPTLVDIHPFCVYLLMRFLLCRCYDGGWT
jgi:hypothetical protein